MVIVKIKSVKDAANSLTKQIVRAVVGIRQDINNSRGTIHALLKNTLLKLNQNMEALKHHFLFSGSFKKLEKQKQKKSKPVKDSQ